jgi:CheY-like chemotaxis protein
MSFRVREILLVSSLYDSFTLAEDGKLQELMLDEFLALDLRHTPGLTQVSTTREAVNLAKDTGSYNLIVASMRLGGSRILELAQALRKAGIETPLVVLGYDNVELSEFAARGELHGIERLFLWQGDVRILLAIVKYIEDKMNAPHDVGMVGVPAILLIEDSVRFYSSFLPAIYTELVKHAHSLIPGGINRSHKLMRVRARPRILLCSSYEEAWDTFRSYPDNILGVISDIEFPKGGSACPDAGIQFASQVREKRPDIPIVLQSKRPDNEALAREAGVSFLLKDSPRLLEHLRKFMATYFGFGDFVFRLRDGTEVGRATDLLSLAEMVRTVPDESLLYHGDHNHFSIWLRAHAELALAQAVRPRRVADFGNLDEFRADFTAAIGQYRRARTRGKVADFDRETYDGSDTFSRIGGGSLGGKARGLAFVATLLDRHHAERRFKGVSIHVPPTVVLGTEVFERFLEENDLAAFAISSTDDDELAVRFGEAALPQDIRDDLRAFLMQVRYPLAVRSSSLLEDSQYRPFAGVYTTRMLANNHADVEERLAELCAAIKEVYASTFRTRAKSYLKGTPYRLEEEKMAVILQKVVGGAHGPRFYPNFAGVARSHNAYPIAPMSSVDGIAAVALGLGTMVSEGGASVRFCPRYPQHLMQLSSVDEALRSTQRHFYAVDLAGGSGSDLCLGDLSTAQDDGTLAPVGSTYSAENRAIYDGVSRPGARLVSFAPVLKHGLFPLADILDFLLEIGEEGTRSPVELEFAVHLGSGSDQAREFGFLQLRPLTLMRVVEALELEQVDADRLLVMSKRVLGHGVVGHIRDVVVVDREGFDRSRSREVAQAVARFNARLVAEDQPFILVGQGRWGSADPFLGIPVTWEQIAGVRVIVEAGLEDMDVAPSQGTHFFQNLTASKVGYFTVNPERGEGHLDWAWMANCEAVDERGCVRHLRFDDPLIVKMDGRSQRGMIYKPTEA